MTGGNEAVSAVRSAILQADQIGKATRRPGKQILERPRSGHQTLGSSEARMEDEAENEI